MIKINISCEDIVEEYSDLVYRIAIAQVKKKEDAEDIFQDVFISLVKNRDKIISKEHLKHWLIRATINRSKNHFSSFWVKKVDVCNDIASQTENSEFDEIRNNVLSLPKKWRDVVYLHYYEGYPIGELAKILDIPEGTVKSRLYKARKLLKIQLQEE